MDAATEARADGEAEAGTVDGFCLPVPVREPKRPAIGELRAADPKKDYSLFTLDYAFRKVGGREAAIALARLASARDDRLKGVVQAYGELTSGQKKRRPKLLESLCIENGVDPSEFLGICTAVAHRYQLDTSSMLASIELEDVVRTGLEQAKRPEGFQDRKLIYEHSTFLPTKGPGVAVQINNAPTPQGAALPEFRSLSEIALQAIAKAALPAAPPEKEEDFIDVVESDVASPDLR